MSNIKYTHYNLQESGPSPHFPAPAELVAQEGAGWPAGTVEVQFDHQDHVTCVVLEGGDSYSIDVDGYGQDDDGDFYIGYKGIVRRDTHPDYFR